MRYVIRMTIAPLNMVQYWMGTGTYNANFSGRVHKAVRINDKDKAEAFATKLDKIYKHKDMVIEVVQDAGL